LLFYRLKNVRSRTDKSDAEEDHGLPGSAAASFSESELLMSQAFTTFQSHHPQAPLALRALSTIAAAVMLVACGGEGGGSISANSGSEVVLTAREATAVQGTLESVKYRLETMSWSITPLSPDNQVLLLVNADCASAVKNDMVAPTPSTSSSLGGSGGSTWDCSLFVYSNQDVKTDALYRLQLTGLNEAGQQVSYQRTLRVQPNPVPIDSLIQGPNTTQLRIQPQASICKPGAPLLLSAQGLELNEQINFYSWSVIQGPDTPLSGYETRNLALITPVVTSPTVLVLQLAASNAPITAELPALYVATALINVDPAAVACFSP
jgi:hypothetical protein